mgnify:FL=1
MKEIDKILEVYLNKIGKIIGFSDWLTIDQDLINKFASITFDSQFIHTDTEKAKLSNFGSTISHGFLILSLSTKFKLEAIPKFQGEKMKINYGFNKLRFTNPVKRNDSIRGVFLLQEISKKSENDLLFNFKLTTEIKGKDKPALVCDWLSLSVF